MTKKPIASLIAALLASPALAFEPFTITDIRVEGIQRTEAGTVFGYLPVKVGDVMTDERAADAVKRLFGTGFFKDVRLEIDGGVLVVLVEERPAIAAIDFVGLKAFDKDQLRKGLKDVGLAESRIFDRALVERAEQELKRQYLSQGYYAVQITTTVTPLERNRVGINFNVQEGEIARIKQINIIGTKAFDEDDLLDLFVLRTPGWFTWYTKNDQYSKQKLTGDLETLRSHYLDRGYLEFNVESTQVAISPDKQDIYITINVSEGNKYAVSSVKLAGELLLPEDELIKLVKIMPGESYSREKLTESTKAIGDRLGNEGYAFANVNAAPEVDKERHEVAFTIFVDPGRRVYVRRINVTGNARTRDEVVRREMRQMEASWYDGDKINKSRTRVDRLGYFDEVAIETPAVAGTTDQVDVNINVKERPTGSLALGVGFSSTEKITLSGSIQQQNLFGTGNSLGLSVNTSKVNTVYSLSYTNPYSTVDGVSRGVDLYHRKYDNTSLTSVATYAARSSGGGLRFGIPISEDDTINLGLAYDKTKLKVDSTSLQRYQDYVSEFGDTNTTLLGSFNWSRQTVDSRFYPTRGYIQSVGIETALPGGNLRYYKLSYQQQRFFPLSKKVTLALNGEFGYANGYAGYQLPFFKNYYAGGIGSVRSYEPGSLGPVDASTDQRLGGNRRLILNGELLVPMPGTGLDKSIRLGAFIDGGQVWGADDEVDLSTLRYSYGVVLAWSSPIGPLKFSFGQPINKKEGDKIQRLQFQMGTVF
ncbi:MAG: outer membrane protein assembly factor BamA [Gammaproteobacteria bacterium]|nr:outer membrane protein assembly factor BamA [Gammaproteobacteria bacterium]MBU1414963.1 outer membrane protein assembly factor BamA [Gammaproteobacteria bacterium]